MRYYKDQANRLHAIELGFEHLLPEGCAQVTDEEAEAFQAPTVEQLAAIEACRLERLAIDEVRADAKFQSLIAKTPQQCKNWCENNFPSLTLAEQRDLATIVIAIGILGRGL